MNGIPLQNGRTFLETMIVGQGNWHESHNFPPLNLVDDRNIWKLSTHNIFIGCDEFRYLFR